MKPRTAPGWQRAWGRTASVTATAEPPSAKNNAAPAMTVDGLTRIGVPPEKTLRASSLVRRTVAAASRRRPAVDDEVGAGDRVVRLDVAILARHPRLDPRRPGGLAVAGDAAREARLVRGLDPHPHVVVVPEHPVERADALDDDDPARLDHAGAARPAGVPVPRGVSRVAPAEQRLEHLGAQPGQLEPLAVPELVRRHDLRCRDRAASVDLPAPPRPPMPTKVKAFRGAAEATRSRTGWTSTAPRLVRSDGVISPRRVLPRPEDR